MAQGPPVPESQLPAGLRQSGNTRIRPLACRGIVCLVAPRQAYDGATYDLATSTRIFLKRKQCSLYNRPV